MISLKQLQDVKFPLPPIEQQQALANLFLEREQADDLARRSIEQRHRVIETALNYHLNT